MLLTEATDQVAGDLADIELEALEGHSFRNVPARVPIFRALPPRAPRSTELDPVCRMNVDPTRSAGTLVAGGVTYHFCSLECAAAFAADTERFVSVQGATHAR